jgi:hypothetical protein
MSQLSIERIEPENENELLLATAITVALGGTGVSCLGKEQLQHATERLNGGSFTGMRREFQQDVLQWIVPVLESVEFDQYDFQELRTNHARELAAAIRSAAVVCIKHTSVR